MDTVVADITVPRGSSRPAAVNAVVTTLNRPIGGTLTLESLDGRHSVAIGRVSVEPFSGTAVAQEVDIASMRRADVEAVRLLLETDDGRKFYSVAERFPE